MLKRGVFVIAASAIVATLTTVGPSRALTMQECSAKYKAAQAAGSKLKWNDFRKAECGSDAAATPAAAPGTVAPAATTAAPAKPAAKPAETKPSAATQAAAGSAVFPTAIAPKYSKETEGKARMHTCLDQYNANKATNANGGLNWIQKGGGYYSECNKRLKS